MGASIVVFSLRNFYKGKTKGKRGKREMGGREYGAGAPDASAPWPPHVGSKGLEKPWGQGERKFYKNMRKGLMSPLKAKGGWNK